jgi:hypothetical protein
MEQQVAFKEIKEYLSTPPVLLQKMMRLVLF